MSHTTATVAAMPRERLGTRYARRLRDAGRMPAVIYGHGEAPVAISVDEKEILKLLHQGSHVVEVSIEGGGTETCLVKDLQFGYLGDNVIHIDFARVNLQEKVTVRVTIEFVGEPVLAAGTLLTHDHSELALTCRVVDIPDSIRIDLTSFTGTHLLAGDIHLPEGVELAMEPSESICSVTRVRMEEAEPAAADDDDVQPEVLTQKDGDEA